jgi:hypothetical protein
LIYNMSIEANNMHRAFKLPYLPANRKSWKESKWDCSACAS